MWLVFGLSWAQHIVEQIPFKLRTYVHVLNKRNLYVLKVNKMVCTYLVNVHPAAGTVVCTQVLEFDLADCASVFRILI